MFWSVIAVIVFGFLSLLMAFAAGLGIATAVEAAESMRIERRRIQENIGYEDVYESYKRAFQHDTIAAVCYCIASIMCIIFAITLSAFRLH